METAVRSSRRASRAEEWALVLASAGIPHRLEPSGPRWALIVPDEDVARALEALDLFDEEARATPRAGIGRPAERPIPWPIGVATGVLLLAFFAVTGSPADGPRWFDRGAAVARLMLAEPWRAVTALTLHLDAAHAAGNAVATAVLLPAVAHRFGAGVAVALVLLAGAGGNLLAALGHAPGHAAVGASTATFAAIGILGIARLFPASGEGRAGWKPWAVPVASLLLLAFLGAGRGADVLGHGAGFLSGAAVGLLAAGLRRPLAPSLQWALGILAALVVAGCWIRAAA